MWLLNTTSFNLHYFTGDKTPKYVILSHRWESQEVSFRHLSELNMVQGYADETEEERQKVLEEIETFPYLSELQHFRKRALERMNGWLKIKKFCEKAQELGSEWGWVDTCCIDKSSSSELQEAINSMYKWYHKAHMCVVYMSDVTLNMKKKNEEEAARREFAKSQWFTRGWTLQELLAPGKLIFVNRNWSFLGSRSHLDQEISEATGIRIWWIRSGSIYMAEPPSFAEKMSWVADRKTAREEDLVYCLLGMFKVNMPLLYGEGQENAFIRFQAEVIKTTHDESMFVWKGSNFALLNGVKSPRRGLLAVRPSQFKMSKDTTACISNQRVWSCPWYGSRQSWTMNRSGQQIEMALFEYKPGHHPNLPSALRREITSNFYVCPVLSVLEDTATQPGKTIFIILRKLLSTSSAIPLFERVGSWFEDILDEKALGSKRQLITITQTRLGLFE